MAENRDKLVIIRGKFRDSRVEFPVNDSAATLKVFFNPTEYTISKRTSFAEAAIPGLDSPLLQFSKGEARTLTLELLVDSYTYGDGADIRSEFLGKLQALQWVDGELHAPPPCKVVWGSTEFVGVLEDLKERFVMFLDDGTPVRARVNLTFKEYLPIADQLSGTRRASPDRRKVHGVKLGETLWQLAYEAYGDPRRWKLIAECNDIENARDLTPGTLLEIPILEPKAGVFAREQ